MFEEKTSATQTGELWPQLEVKLMRMLTPLFEEMKLGRLKVNEEKTGLILLGGESSKEEATGRRRKKDVDVSRREDRTQIQGEVTRTCHLRRYELDRRSGSKTSQVQSQAEVTDETERDCKPRPEENTGTRGHHEQVTSAPGSD